MKRMTRDNGVPAGYLGYQTACLSARSANAELKTIAQTERYVAETTLQITNRYAGDNYQVRATLRNPSGNEFDTLSGMTAGASFVTTSIKASETLIAWKRVYIEQDNMYTLGCTLTDGFAGDADPNYDVLTVDTSADFAVGDSVIIFWQGGRHDTTITAIASPTTVTVPALPGNIMPIPQWAGIRPATEPATCVVDRRYLPNAFGNAPNGSDGGAFIEFQDMGTERQSVPAYHYIQGSANAVSFSTYWFNNHADRKNNVMYLLAANKYTNDFQKQTDGTTSMGNSICIIWDGQKNSVAQRDDTTAHEIGHRFFLSKDKFPHIDKKLGVKSHNDLDFCLMGYDRNRTNDIVEFSILCLLTGSAPGMNDSLRDFEDQ